MSTVATSADLDRETPPPPPPTGPAGRVWAWWAGGSALLAGGVLTAAGGALRWWGPQRVADLTMRENDDANPLFLDPTNVHPGSGELVASGSLLVALGLLLFCFLPWRGWAARLLAYPALISGVVSVGLEPARWWAWRLGVVPASLGTDAEQPPEWWSWLAGASAVWLYGVGPLLVATAALLCLRNGAHTLVWQRAMAVCFALLLTSALFEYFANFTVFLSTSHDDPVGTHVTSGLAAAAAGLLAFWAARGARIATRTGSTATSVSAPDPGAAPRPTRTSWCWTAAGVMFVLAGVITVVTVLVYPPDLMLAADADGPSPGQHILAVANVLATALGHALLAAGPWRGVRRVVAVVLAVVMVAAGSAGAALFLGAATVPAFTEPLSGMWGLVGVLQSFESMGLVFVVVALLLVWEQARTAPVRGWGIAVVVVTAQVGLVVSVVTERLVFLMEHPWPIVVMAPGLATALFGMAWLIGAGRIRRASTDGGDTLAQT